MDLLKFRIISTKLKLKYILDPKIEIKRKTIPKKIRNLVWETYISKKDRLGKCFCCRNKEISSDEWHCGHVISDKNKGKPEIENLRPLCSSCNLSMSDMNMYEFINYYGFWK